MAPPPVAGQVRYRTAAGRGLLAAVVLGSAVAFLDATVVAVALPTIGADLDAAFSQLQWVVTGYTLSLAALIPVSGSLADRWGRRRVYRAGLAAFGATSVLCAVAPTIEALVAARVLQGVAGAVVTPGSLALVQSSFARDDRGRAIGAWAGISGLAPALGPALGGWLTEQDWRWVFVVNVPVTLAAWLATGRYVPESADPSPGPLDGAGAALAVLALGAATLGLVAAGGQGSVGLVVGGAAIAALAGIGFVARERRAEAPMVPLSLFANRTFSLTNAATLLVYAALSGGVLFLLVIQLQTTLGYRPTTAGFATVPVMLTLALLSPAAGTLPGKVGPRLPLVVGPLLASAGMILLAFLTADSDYVGGVLPGLLLVAAGLTLIVAPLTTTVLAAAPDRYAGTASGVNNAVSRAGGLLAVAALPSIVGLSAQDYADPEALTAGYRPAMLLCAALLLVAALIGSFVPARLEDCG